MLRKKYVTIDEKTLQKLSCANRVFINIFYFIFIKCRTDKNHVHIETLYLIGCNLIYNVWPICIEFVITCLFATQFTYVILLINLLH